MNAHINGRNVVVTVTGEDTPDVRKAARKAACGEAHTATIGKLIKVAETKDGHAYTWGPVTPRGTRAARPAAPDHGVNPAELLALALAGDAVSAERLAAILAGKASTAPAPRTERKPFAPVEAAKARKAAAACPTCLDHGVVRIKARDNGSVHYRTADGAAASTKLGNAKPCEARGCKAGKAARKAAKAA